MRISKLLQRVTYANVVATFALFVALGGSSYAALHITGRDVQNRSLTGRDIRNNSLTGKQLRESRLGVIPRARVAGRVGDFTGRELVVRCLPGMQPAAGTCFEIQPRAPASLGAAMAACHSTDLGEHLGRRLPLYEELRAALEYEQVGLASGGEWTSPTELSSTVPDDVDALWIKDEDGHVGRAPNSGAVLKAYRCIAPPVNG